VSTIDLSEQTDISTACMSHLKSDTWAYKNKGYAPLYLDLKIYWLQLKYFLWVSLTGLVHPKMKIMSLMIHPHTCLGKLTL